MNDNREVASQWGWLEDPDTALDLHGAERRAFYEWDALVTEWSKATRGLNSKDRKLSKKKNKALKTLKKRLNKAAKAYDMARNKLHEALSA
jgi:hypothetical protein